MSLNFIINFPADFSAIIGFIKILKSAEIKITINKGKDILSRKSIYFFLIVKTSWGDWLVLSYPSLSLFKVQRTEEQFKWEKSPWTHTWLIIVLIIVVKLDIIHTKPVLLLMKSVVMIFKKTFLVIKLLDRSVIWSKFFAAQNHKAL